MAWCAEYDEWGNLLGEENPEHLEQLIRLPGQQYDEESGLHYNRHRYYSPGLGQSGRDLKKCMELKRVYLQEEYRYCVSVGNLGNR
ncbi:TPA: RHS repeat-associated core domain-containing protein [Salmonella enterica]